MEKKGPHSSNRQKEIDQIQWYHEFDFPGGLRARARTPDSKDHRRIWRFIEAELDRIDFRDKTVLEIGAWDGYWSFYAERRGAKHVLATDDLTQNWSTGEGIRIARELLNSQIEVRQDVSIYELSSLGQRFDIIICLGVYYHLLDPLYGFGQIRHCCHPGTQLLLEGDLVHRGMALNEMRLNYNNQQEFLPSESALARLLKFAYLEVKSQVWMMPHPESRFFGRRMERPVLNRAFTVCRPVEGVNDCHAYEPPFGLKAYDQRFGGPRPS